ncbi:MAG: sugar ABC transporter permease [Pyrinomonadaceae bacterium]|nr:sugar ABC transporter permease [Phycisphaerales bacterium]
MSDARSSAPRGVSARGNPTAATGRPRSPGGAGGTLVGLAWVSPWIIGFLAFMALPLGMSFYYSLSDYPLLEPPLYVGTQNYTALLNDDIFWLVLKNTVIYAAFSVPLGTVLALLIAGLLNQRVKGVGLFRLAVFVPQVVPVAASAMIWMWLFNGDVGLINQLLELIGVTHTPNWLGDRAWAMPALIVMNLWVIGQSVVIYLAALQDVPKQLYEAASLDGMGPARRFWHVALPTISPVVLFNVIILTITCWQVFAVPYIMTDGGPDRATYFYTHYLYDNAFVYQKMGYASALAWVQFLIILSLTGVMFFVSRKVVSRD